MTHSGPDGALLAVDALLLAASEPPTVIVLKDASATAAGNALGGGGAGDDTLGSFGEVVDRVAEEFGNVVVADATVGWDPSTMLGADGLHINAAGADHYAGAVAEALRAAGV